MSRDGRPHYDNCPYGQYQADDPIKDCFCYPEPVPPDPRYNKALADAMMRDADVVTGQPEGWMRVENGVLVSFRSADPTKHLHGDFVLYRDPQMRVK